MMGSNDLPHIHHRTAMHLPEFRGIKLLEQIDGRNGGHKESGVQRLPCRLVARFSCGASQTLAAKRKGDKANQR